MGEKIRYLSKCTGYRRSGICGSIFHVTGRCKEVKRCMGISAEYNMGSRCVEVNSQFQQKYGWMPNLWFGEMYRHIILWKDSGRRDGTDDFVDGTL